MDHQSHAHSAACGAARGPAAEFSGGDADLLDLDGEVLHAYLSQATAWVYQAAAGRPVHRILDVGCGTGNGALALAERFGGAEVIAVDQSGDLLARLRARARDRGLDDRVQTVEADLDQAWPAVGPVDVTWTSMALHHLADPDRALREIFAATRPGGLLAVAESTAPMRFLPDDIGLGRPGLEARAQAAVAEHHSGTMPYLGADWGPLVARAGFTGVAERAFGIELGPPLPGSAGRYAQGYLRRVRGHLDGALAPDDLATLDVLIGDDGPAASCGARTWPSATRAPSGRPPGHDLARAVHGRAAGGTLSSALCDWPPSGLSTGRPRRGWTGTSWSRWTRLTWARCSPRAGSGGRGRARRRCQPPRRTSRRSCRGRARSSAWG